VTTIGWTWDQCLDQLTAPRLEALEKIWTRWPPVHKLLAAFVGYKAPEPVESKAEYLDPKMVDRIIQGSGAFITGDMLGGSRGGQR
jgi:hypothetical protein